MSRVWSFLNWSFVIILHLLLLHSLRLIYFRNLNGNYREKYLPIYNQRICSVLLIRNFEHLRCIWRQLHNWKIGCCPSCVPCVSPYNIISRKVSIFSVMDQLPKLGPRHLRNWARKLVRVVLIDWGRQKVNENFCTWYIWRVMGIDQHPLKYFSASCWQKTKIIGNSFAKISSLLAKKNK